MLKNRFRRILFFFGKLTLGIIFWDIVLTQIGFRRLAGRTRSERYRKAAARFRILAIDMGGVMIKVGQFLSTRLDVLPQEITRELQGLQDEVNPEDFDIMRAELENELGKPVGEIFEDFEAVPMASASIGQAHRALIKLDDDMLQKVVVKIQRPNIKGIVETDLAALKIVSRWMHYYKPIRKRVNVPALMEELDASIHEEMDYLLEGQYAEKFAENFIERDDVIVPKVFWNFTTQRIISLEDVQGIKIMDVDAIRKVGIDPARVAMRLFDTYLKQIFEDGFFHADPHPGNLFVNPVGEDENGEMLWKLAFVDFGMVGKVEPKALNGMKELVIAVGVGDAARMVQAEKDLNFLLPSADLDLLEKAYSKVFERFWGKSTTEMMNMHSSEMADFVIDFGDLLYDMPFQLPENFILLGRCLSILSGMCTGLDKNFNIWGNIAPYAEKLVVKDGENRISVFLKELTEILLSVSRLPKKTENMLSRMEQGQLEVRTPELSQQLKRLESTQSKQVNAVLFAAFLLGAVQLYLAEETALASALGGAAFFVLLLILFKSNK